MSIDNCPENVEEFLFPFALEQNLKAQEASLAEAWVSFHRVIDLGVEE